MKKICIMKTGTAKENIVQAHGDMDEFVSRGLGTDNWFVCDVIGGEPLPSIDACSGVVITGSYAMVTDRLEWSLNLEQWLNKAIEQNLPILGICYGHQLLAQATGGKVGFHPEGVEIGTIEVSLNTEGQEDELLGQLPAEFPAQAVHFQSVLELPPNAVRLAANEFEPNHAFRIGECAWGVQFHPEFNSGILGMIIQNRKTALEEEGIDTNKTFSNLKETPVAATLLTEFTEIVEARESLVV